MNLYEIKQVGHGSQSVKAKVAVDLKKEGGDFDFLSETHEHEREKEREETGISYGLGYA